MPGKRNKDCKQIWTWVFLSGILLFCFSGLSVVAADAPIVTAARVINATPGAAAVPIPITVSNFNNVGNFLLTLKFDTTKVRYVSGTANAALSGMSIVYTAPSGNTQGKLVLSWTGASNLSLANGASIANLVFSYTTATGILSWAYTYGSVCQFKTYVASTLTLMTDSPKYLFYINGGISNRSAPVTTAPTLINPAVGAIAVPIITTGFTNIGALTLYLEYDPAIITYANTFTKNAALNSSFLVGDIAGSGTKRIIVMQWYGTAISITNGATLCTLNFTYATTNGTNTNLSWFDNGPSCEFTDAAGNVLIDMPTATYYQDGYIGTSAIGVLLHKGSNCGEFSLMLKPITALSANITNITFTIKWAAATGTDVQLTALSTSYPGLAQVGSRVLYNGFYYVTFRSLSSYAVNWAANTEYNILGFSHTGLGSGNTDFTVIPTDYNSVAPGLNTAWHIEVASVNITGSITNDAVAVNLNCGIHLKDILQGAYNTGTHLMKTNLATAGYLPLTQPYNSIPWLYAGTEHISTYPANFVDWVLVELRTGTAAATSVGRRAGLLLSNGSIVDTNGSAPLVFHTFAPGSAYYVVVYHRSHLPVMTATAISLPNTAATRKDFSLSPAGNVYSTTNEAVILLESGVYGHIAGDLNSDNKLKYSGPANDRGTIMAKITALYPSPPATLNSTISGYYAEDLNMDGVVKYSGPANDQALIFSNIDALTNPTTLISVYLGQVAVSYAAKSGPSNKDKKASGMTIPPTNP